MSLLKKKKQKITMNLNEFVNELQKFTKNGKKYLVDIVFTENGIEYLKIYEDK